MTLDITWMALRREGVGSVYEIPFSAISLPSLERTGLWRLK
jgi:hypothetical protein